MKPKLSTLLMKANKSVLYSQDHQEGKQIPHYVKNYTKIEAFFVIFRQN